MKTKPFLIILTLGFVSVSVCLAGDPTIEQALRDLNAQWSKAAAAKDLEKTVSFYANDATVMPANAPIATTKDAIRDIWKDFMANTGFAVSWMTTKVEVAKSGEMACVSGTYQSTLNDASGTPVNDHGKYVEVWEKQADGTWKCGADIWNSDLPASVTAALEKK